MEVNGAFVDFRNFSYNIFPKLFLIFLKFFRISLIIFKQQLFELFRGAKFTRFIFLVSSLLCDSLPLFGPFTVLILYCITFLFDSFRDRTYFAFWVISQKKYQFQCTIPHFLSFNRATKLRIRILSKGSSLSLVFVATEILKCVIITFALYSKIILVSEMDGLTF